MSLKFVNKEKEIGRKAVIITLLSFQKILIVYFKMY